ncbi:hypothetical protein [Flavobacterium sp. LS1R10]|uniref:hypothetical protein n=1 Tax=Flavobacterium sp. LS1R10 TaxID=2497482 RepID=UPI00131574A1|nr:hypothetical protein [Flavobacterium sp. LS1R10]
MKNYLKFVVAVFGVTIATFGTITNATAKIAPIDNSCDNSIKNCGTTPDGQNITGNYS